MGDSYTTLTWSWITLDQQNLTGSEATTPRGWKRPPVAPMLIKVVSFSEDSKSPFSSLATIPVTEWGHQRLWLFLFVYRTVRLSPRPVPASIPSCLLQPGTGAGPLEENIHETQKRKTKSRLHQAIFCSITPPPAALWAAAQQGSSFLAAARRARGAGAPASSAMECALHSTATPDERAERF